MGWASRYIEKLRAGETVSFRPHGHSMTGRIESGQLCTVVPIDPATLEVGDIVLCKLAGNQYLHIVKAIQDGRYQIGNNRGSSTAGHLASRSRSICKSHEGHTQGKPKGPPEMVARHDQIVWSTPTTGDGLRHIRRC